MIDLPFTLAQFPAPPIDQIGLWVWRFIGVAAGLIVLLTLWEKIEHRFARRPPIDDDLKALQKALDGYAPKEVTDKILAQLEKAASKEDLAKVLALVNDKEQDLARQVKDVRSYAHDAVHDARGDLGARLMKIEEREEDGDGKMWQVINGLRLAIADIDKSVTAQVALREANGDRLVEMSKEFRTLSDTVNQMLGAFERFRKNP